LKKKKSHSQRRLAMALPLVLVFLLFGSILVATALYIVENMYSTTNQAVAHSQLYNAAVSGVENAKDLLWQNKADLEGDALTYDGTLASIYGRKEDGTILGPVTFTVEPGVSVNVVILDCNYVLGTGQSYSALLPPRYPAGTGTGAGGTSALPGGTSAIIDPGRFLPFGGGAGEHRYVIRSSASKNGKDFTAEVMVVVTE